MRIVVRDRPVARSTAAIPPSPIASASAAAPQPAHPFIHYRVERLVLRSNLRLARHSNGRSHFARSVDLIARVVCERSLRITVGRVEMANPPTERSARPLTSKRRVGRDQTRPNLPETAGSAPGPHEAWFPEFDYTAEERLTQIASI